MERLLTLKAQYAGRLEPSAFLACSVENLGQLGEKFAREVDIQPLGRLLDAAMHRFKKGSTKSDAWLAPRVHASLRLTRREAGDIQMWRYLALHFRDYVIWRWADEAIDAPRISGGVNRQALARLWWLAELTRNGSGYESTTRAAKLQDAVTWILDINVFHNRPATLAYISFLEQGANAAYAKKVAKCLNHAAVTVVIEALAPDDYHDSAALLDWLNESVDETVMMDDLPAGPDEPVVPDEVITEIEAVIERVAPPRPGTSETG